MTALFLTQIKRIVRLLAAALVVIGAMGLSGWWGAARVAETFGWVNHTHQVLYELESTLMHAVSIQSGARGFALTGEDRFLAPYESGLVRIQQSLTRLTVLTADNPRQQSRVSHLTSFVNEEIAVMQQRLAARRHGGLNAASVATADGRGKQVVENIRGVIAAMQQEERILLDQRSRTAQFYGWIAVLILMADSVIAGALIGTAIMRTRRLPRSFDVAMFA